MIRREYSRSEKRAASQVYNGAGRYDFEPFFLAVRPDGRPEIYLNTLIGLSVKWLDSGKLSAFFDSYSAHLNSDDLDTIVWLGLENYLYEKEVPERPMLRRMRASYAEAFFNSNKDLSRQQMMSMNVRIFEQRQARWAEVLKRHKPALTPKAAELAEALKISPVSADKTNVIQNYSDKTDRSEKSDESNKTGEYCQQGTEKPEQLSTGNIGQETDRVILELKNILEKFFRVHDFSGKESERSHGITASELLKKIMYRETRQTDSLLIRQSGTGSSRNTGRVRMLERGRRSQVRTEEDEEYIRACFGRCLYTDHEMKLLENDLCRGNHEYCRLYIAGKQPVISASGTSSDKDTLEKDKSSNNIEKSENADSSGQQKDMNNKLEKEAAKIRHGIEEQRKKNKAYLDKNGELIASSIRSLSAQLDTILATYAEPLPEESARGRLNTGKCYRLALFQDPMVFTRPGDESEHRIKIDILLDASASRLNVQEMISAQTYVLVKSLEKCHVPVRVMTFRSLKGYTVLQVLKSYSDKSADGLLSYYAAGWNRDGLALSTAGRLIRESDKEDDGCEHVLFILTDANPDDSTHIPASGGMGLDREYEGTDAVIDTAETVKNLRQQGIHTAAVFLGSTAYADNVNLIYGTQYVTVKNIEILASRIASLFQMTLTEMKN